LQTVDGFEVTPIVQDLQVPETCAMHISSGLFPEQLSNSLLHLIRNTQKARVVTPDGTVMHINKRTEFIVDLSKLTGTQAKQLSEAMARNGMGERNTRATEYFFVGDDLFFLSDDIFGEYDAMITSRHPAIEPINSTAYVYREVPERPRAADRT